MNSPATNLDPSNPVNLSESFPLPVSQEVADKFVYMVAHEIRNPLSNIKMAIEILTQSETDERQKKYFEIIKRNSNRIKDLIAALLSSNDTYGMKPRSHSVRCLLEEVLTINEDRFVLKDIAVTKSYSTEDFKMDLNSDTIKIAFTNIIINAIEAMPAKNGLLEITTKLLRGIYFIIIKDNGTGISKENLTDIFKPYFTSTPGGMGLGLPGALSIFKTNHIGMNVRSEVGVGTRFIMSYEKKQE